MDGYHSCDEQNDRDKAGSNCPGKQMWQRFPGASTCHGTADIQMFTVSNSYTVATHVIFSTPAAFFLVLPRPSFFSQCQRFAYSRSAR
jgi:hypothetical protein